MNDITNVPKPDVNTGYVASPQPEAIRAETPQIKAQAPTSSEDPQDLVNNDPKLKALFNQVVGNFKNLSNEEAFSVNKVLLSLIDLGQSLQAAATVQANRLEKLTEIMNGYATIQTQIPVLLKKDIADDRERADVNAKFANMLDGIRATKGIYEDKSKKAQTMLQTLKDSGSQASDFVTEIMRIISGLVKKISQ